VEVTYYRSDRSKAPSPVASALKKIASKRPKLFANFSSTVHSIRVNGLAHLRDTKPEWVRPLRHLEHPIWELRIPPRRRGGVLRAYYFQFDNNEICILDVQLKKSDDKAETGAAVARYHEMMRDRR
jgi:hypothetical protein